MRFDTPQFNLFLTLHRLGIYTLPQVRLFLAFENHKMHLEEHIKLVQQQFSVNSIVLPYDK